MATPQQLMTAAQCIDCGIPEGMKLSVLIYQLGLLTGVTNPQTLMANAACIDCAIPAGMRLSVLISQFDAWAGGGGGDVSGGVTCKLALDPSGVPTNNCGIWVRLDNSKMWVYNSNSGNWNLLLG